MEPVEKAEGFLKFGILISERCFANSEFGTMLRKFGIRNDASQIRNSEFGEYVTSGLRLRLSIAVGDDALGVPLTGTCEAQCFSNSEF